MPYCKECASKIHKTWTAKNYALKIKPRMAKFVLTPEAKDSAFRRKYDITFQGYNLQFQIQGGCCAICLRHQSEFPRSLAIDHDHVTNKFRGLLCDGCNIGLGMFKDNLDSLKMAIKYLERRIAERTANP